MSAEKKELSIPDSIKILKINIPKLIVDSPLGFNIANTIGHDFGLGFQISFDRENSLAMVNLEMNATSKSKEGVEKEAKGIFHLNFVFRIEDLSRFVTVDDEKKDIAIDSVFGASIASIAYSTARGILLVKLSGTDFSKFILPVVDPRELLVNK